MKWLLAPFLWLGAAVIAGYVVYRLWRGKPLILRGTLGPRVLRLVAILLVVFGAGIDDRPIQGAQPGVGGQPALGRQPTLPELPARLPENITLPEIDRWLAYQRVPTADSLTVAHATWHAFKSLYVRIEANPTAPGTARLRELLRDGLKQFPQAFAQLIEADLRAREAGKEPRFTARQLLAAFHEMDSRSYFDAWLIAWMWRHTVAVDATREPEAVELMTRLARHVRITHALIRAHAQVKPVDLGPRAWMSKAGPGPNVTGNGFDRFGLAHLGKAYLEQAGKADLGPWRQDGIARFRLPEKGPLPTLLRDGVKIELKAGEELRLGRLDLLQTPAEATIVLEHDVFGKVALPGGQTLLVWDLARHLDDATRLAISTIVRAALDGKEEAARQIEQSLPICQLALREELKRQPGAPGAAKLRLILALFDDALLLAPPPKDLPEKAPEKPIDDRESPGPLRPRR